MNIKKSYIFVSLFFILISSNVGSQNNQTIPVYNFKQIEPMLNPDASNDTTYIFNFWATYCAPCIKELPYFDKIANNHSSEKLKVVLISLDFKSQIESRVFPFINKRGVESQVILLSDPDANSWIDKVDPSWSGAIPATLIVKGKRKEFHEKEFNFDELELLTNKFLEK